MQTLNAQRLSAPMMTKLIMTALVAASVIGVAGTARAESNFQTGPLVGALTATTHLDFQIVIPKMIYLRVGTGVDRTTVATVDLINFAVPAANVGDSSVIAGTGGDLGAGVVTARVISNLGTVTLSTITPNGIKNVAGDVISYSQIALAVGLNTSLTALTPPAMTDGTTTTNTITPVASVVNQDAKWTFTYKNQSVVPAGTYGGINTNQSRVTYTAAIP